jgi:hypothetical protein
MHRLERPIEAPARPESFRGIRGRLQAGPGNVLQYRPRLLITVSEPALTGSTKVIFSSGR